MASTENPASIQQQSKKEILCTYDGCLKKFSSITHLNRHETSFHINKTYGCEECSSTFKTQYAQKRHFDNIHLKKNPKKYKCDYCEEDFNKKSWLNKHSFRHTGIKPYACTFEKCEARFVVPSKLKRHMKMHEGYVCPKENCNEKFSKFTEVRRHLKIAHPKVYKCPECEQEFSRSNNLKSHLEVHNSDRLLFMCSEEGCHRFYSSKNNLINHILEYHRKRPFKCTVGRCHKAFKSQGDLDAHISKHSPSGRIKKKKKKKRPKPSFAEKLAGLAPKKWQVDLLNNVSKSADPKLSVSGTSDSSCIQDDTEAEPESTADEIRLTDQESSCIDENCDKVSSLISDEEQNNNNLNLNVDDSDCGIQNKNIQTLLNLVEKRKDFETEDLDSHISKHRPKGRLKKKNGKNRQKPSLAEQLAGLAPKKWQVDLLNQASKSAAAKLSIPSTFDLSCIQDDMDLEDSRDTVESMLIELELSCLNQNCDKVSFLTSDEEQNDNCNLNINESDSDCCVQNNDIQILLNLIEKRKDFETASAV